MAMKALVRIVTVTAERGIVVTAIVTTVVSGNGDCLGK